MQGPDGPMKLATKEVMSLDADGTLVIESTTATPMGERKSKLVYKKRSSQRGQSPLGVTARRQAIQPGGAKRRSAWSLRLHPVGSACRRAVTP